ncbi:hypothetical protein CcCBS67573_g01907 [Chytriomyces confervae]|uniref:Peptide hydrolase n=1 Tax=Chytriomyces confervae TaxID=246404 RepID=A0A507FNC0_9FUNG|nr:hypothetical protein CcCBS67573_g01907 [Chytriomyces confervae]
MFGHSDFHATASGAMSGPPVQQQPHGQSQTQQSQLQSQSHSQPQGSGQSQVPNQGGSAQQGEPIRKPKRKKLGQFAILILFRDEGRPCQRCIRRKIAHLCTNEALPKPDSPASSGPSSAVPQQNRNDPSPASNAANSGATAVIHSSSGGGGGAPNSSMVSPPTTSSASTSMMYSFPPPFIGNRSNNGGASGALAGNNNVHSSMMHEDSLFPPLFASADQMGNELTIISDFLASLESPSNNTQAFFNAMQGYPGSRHPPNQQASSGRQQTHAPRQQQQQQQQQHQLQQQTQQQQQQNQQKFEPAPVAAARPGRSASGSSAVLSNGEHGQNPDPESLSSTERFVLTAADPMTVGTNEDRLNQVISAKFEAGLLKPYNYINSYTKLQQWMETHMSPASRTRILNVMGLFRPRFQWVAQRLTDMDLVLVEEAFERMLLEYDRVFSSMGIPSCLWRRTGEIWKCNKEFAELVGLSMDELKDGKLSIYELMSEESAVNYWEKYGNIAFDAGQKAILTSCVLKKPDEDREAAAARTLKEGVNCCFSFTIRRDRYSIPIIIAGNFLPVMDGSYSAPTPQSQARTDPAASYIGCFQGKQEDFLPYGFPFTTISECATLCLQPGPDNPYFLILSRDPHQCVCSSKCSLVQVGDDLVRVPDSICAAGCGEKNGSLCGGYGAASNQFEVYSIRKESATCSEADIVTPMNRLALSSSLLAMAVNAVVLCALVYFLIYEAEEAPQQPRVSSNWKKRVSPFNLQLFLMAVSMIAFFACLYCEALALTAASVYLLPLNFFFSATFKTIYLLHSWARAAKIISSVAPSLAKYFRFLLYLVPIFTYSVTIPAIIFAVLVLETDEELRRIANMSHDCMRILETISIIMMTFVDLGLLVCFILHIFNNTRVSVEDPVDIKFLTICYFGVVTNGLCVVAFAFQIIRFVTVVSQTRFPVNQAMLDAVTHLIFTAVLVALFAMKLALRVQVHLEIGRRRSTLEHGMTKRSSSIKSPRSSMLLSAHDPASDFFRLPNPARIYENYATRSPRDWRNKVAMEYSTVLQRYVVQFLVHVLNLPKFQIGNIDAGNVRTSSAVFSSARAKDHLDALGTHGPRPFSSPANDRALQSLVARLLDGATDRLQVQIDANVLSNAVFADGAGGVEAKRFSLALNNVVATVAGTCLPANSCPTLLVSAHYDSVVGAPGITDDGMAVAAMVEIIHVLETRPPLPYSVVFLFNNAEESGLLGARHFVASNAAFSNVRASINLEGSGSGGPAMLFRSVAYDLDLLNAYAGSVKTPFASVLGNDVMALKLVKSSTDHEIYTSLSLSGSAGSAVEHGKFENRAGLDIAFFQDRYKYHTRNDQWYPDLIYSLQHMGDSALKTVVSLANNEKFMNPDNTSDRLIVPGVYWHELIRIMPVLSFGFYLSTCVLIVAWMAGLIIVGIQRMRNFIKAHAKNVSNVRLQSVVPLFLASTLGSVVLPILVIALIEKIRPLATYGDTFTTRNLTWACSILGSLIPFYFVPSIFSVNHSDSDHPQKLLHWHVCQLGVLIAWVPIAFLVLLSSWYKVGMLHSHATFLIFGLSAITMDWYYLRPWFGKERKQGDDYDRIDDEAAVHESHGRSFEPAHVAALGIAIVCPLLSLLNTRRSLVLAMEPTIQDGTPALAVAGLITLFTFIVPISALPHLISQRKAVVLTCRALIAFTLASTLVLTIPTAAPFTPAHPLKLRLEVNVDLTNATNLSHFANLNRTAHVYLNAVALPHVEQALPGVGQARDCSVVRVRGIRVGRCNLDAVVEGLRGVSFPTSDLVGGTEEVLLEELLDVRHGVSETGTIQVSVKSKYSRVCFMRGVEELNGESWRIEEFEGVYPYNVWNGDLESEPKEANGTVKEAVNFMSHFHETGLFAARLNQTQMGALGISSLEMQVGCYVDDLQHLPLWQDLEDQVLPDWTIFTATGYGGLSISKRFRVTLRVG